MSHKLETVTIYRNGKPVLINKSDLKDTDKLNNTVSKLKKSKSSYKA